MRPVEEALTTGEWRGEPCFVIGGGPSLRGFDFSLLRPFRTVGTNAAWRHADPDVNFITDARVATTGMHDYPEEWKACRSIKVFHKCNQNQPAVRELDDCYLVEVTSRPKWGRSFAEGLKADRGIRGMNNSGIMALNLADILGADPIFLLGMDCKGEDGKSVNFHTDYPDAWRQKADIYLRFKRAFEEFAKPHVCATVYVVETTPGCSALDCWPKLTVEQALELADQARHEVPVTTT